jgi:hypothetical protein
MKKLKCINVSQNSLILETSVKLFFRVWERYYFDTFRFVLFHKYIVSFRFVSRTYNFFNVLFRIVSEKYRFVTFHDLVNFFSIRFVSFQKIMRFLRFFPFRFVPKPCLLILVHYICKPAFYQLFRSSCTRTLGAFFTWHID